MRIFLISALFFIQAFACDYCAAYTPVAHIKAELKTEKIEDKEYIQKLNFKITFSPAYAKLMVQISDRNRDDFLDDVELANATKGLKEYFEGKSFVENIIVRQGGKSQLLEGSVDDFKLTFDEELGATAYVDLGSRFAVEENTDILLNVKQNKESLIFSFLATNPQKIDDELSFLYIAPKVDNKKDQILSSYITQEHNKFKIIKTQNVASFLRSLEPVEIPDIKEAVGNPDNFFSQKSTTFLEKLRTIFKNNSKDYSASSLITIMLVSFLYGFAHAAGPGHAKTLTFSLFAATGEKYLKAFWFAFQVGILHTLGAFVLVFVIVFSLSNASFILGKDVIKISTIVSGALIVLIALLMMINMVKKRNQKYSWSAHPNRCDCPSCVALKSPEKMTLKKWIVAACASLIPCPGTILVFLLAFEVGNYYLGLLSGVFMSLGMGLVIFLSAIFGSNINLFAGKLIKDYDYIKFSALALMAILGGLMILSFI